MKKFNNLDKKYCILVSILTILGVFSVLWLAKPFTVGSEEKTSLTVTTVSERPEIFTTCISGKIITTTSTNTTSTKTSSTATTTFTTQTTVALTTTITEEVQVEEDEEEIIEEDIISEENSLSEEDNTSTDTEEVSVYVVYKPSTHYVHMSNCRWCDSTCREITDTEGLEARKCSECNPDIEIVNEYSDPTPTPTTNTSGHTALDYVTDAERVMLCNVVGGEYGSDWVSLYDKACVVACVMNRYYDGGWQGYGRANTIYNVITAPGQFAAHYGNTYYNWNVTDSCIQAVDYYFENMGSFPHYTSFWGDGRMNHFS